MYYRTRVRISSRVALTSYDLTGKTSFFDVQSIDNFFFISQGCYEKIRLEVVSKHGVVIGVAVAIALVQVGFYCIGKVELFSPNFSHCASDSLNKSND